MNEALRAELLAIVREGRAIEAIKLCRERTGLGLKEARDLVDALRDGREVATPSAAAPTPPSDAEILRLVREGRTIEAIKIHRERSGLGLKEAKDAVDALAAREGIVAPARGCLALLGFFLFR